MAGKLCQTHSFADSSWQDPQVPGLPVGPIRPNYPAEVIRWDVDGTLRQIVYFGQLTIPQMVASGNYTWLNTATEKQFYLTSGTLSEPLMGVYSQINGGAKLTDIYGTETIINSGYNIVPNLKQPAHSGNGIIASYLGPSGVVSGPGVAAVVPWTFQSWGYVRGGAYTEASFFDWTPYIVTDMTGVVSVDLDGSNQNAVSVSTAGFYFYGRATHVTSWVPYGNGKTPVTEFPITLLHAAGGMRPTVIATSEDFASHFSGFANHVGDTNYMQLFNAYRVCKMLDGPNDTVILMLRAGGYLQTGYNTFINVPQESRLFVCNQSGIAAVYNPPGIMLLNQTTVNLNEAQRVFDNGDFLVCCADFWSPGGLYRVDPYGNIVTRYRLPAYVIKYGTCFTSGNDVYLMHSGVSDRPYA